MIFMETHTKVGLACIAKPYTGVIWKVWLLELSPRSVSFSPFSFFYMIPPLSQLSFPFILVFTSRSSPTCQFFPFFGVSIVLPIHTSEWLGVVGESWIAGSGVWACQVLGSTLWCGQLSLLYCSCIEFVIYFRRFVRCWAWDRPRPHPWAFKGLSSYAFGSGAPRPGLRALNTRWAGTADFGPHSLYM